ncbi:MAG: class I adenylate-forming enzyme family protein [Acidimicrobiales bacterium]
MSEPTSIDDLVRRAVAARPDEAALADAPNRASVDGADPVRLTWSELDARIDGAAAALTDLGVGPGVPVGIQLANVVELPITILACFRLGAVAVPFPIQHRAHELRHGIETAGFDVFVTTDRPDRPDQVESATATLRQYGPVAMTPPATAPGPPVESAVVGAETRATICWTSGTTGTPKGVPRTHGQWMASSSFQVSELRIAASDHILCPFPVVNMAGIGGMLVPWAEAGAFLALHQPLDLEVFLGQLVSERITYTVVPPAALNMLLGNTELLDSLDLSTIRTISSGSAPLDPWMVEGWQERGIEIANVFGSNEGAALLSTMAAVPDPTERARYFPIPDRPGVETRLVDLEHDATITEAGTVGELRFRGITVFDGYVGSDGAEFDADGWYRTGDLFEYVADDTPPRLLKFVDRAKDIIIRGGMNISAAEIEALVADHPAIVECAAIGFPHPDLGEKVGVFAVAGPDADRPSLDELVAHLREHEIASYKLPERLDYLDALPRNPVGKVVKPELRQIWRDPATPERQPTTQESEQ